MRVAQPSALGRKGAPACAFVVDDSDAAGQQTFVEQRHQPRQHVCDFPGREADIDDRERRNGAFTKDKLAEITIGSDENSVRGYRKRKHIRIRSGRGDESDPEDVMTGSRQGRGYGPPDIGVEKEVQAAFAWATAT